jgi:hypothetical protein
MGEQNSNILDESLARLSAGEALEDILAEYPSERDELAPLLLAARELTVLRDVPAPVQSELGLAAFLDEAESLREDAACVNGRFLRVTMYIASAREVWWRPRPRLLIASVIAAAVLIGLLAGTAALATDSLPGDWLYPAKLTGEMVHLGFTFDRAHRAEILLDRARTRSEEIHRLLQAGRPVGDDAILRLSSALDASLSAVALVDPGDIPRLLDAFEKATGDQAARFAALQPTVPIAAVRQRLAEAQESLVRAQAFAQAGRADVLTFSEYVRSGSLQSGSVFSALVGGDDAPLPSDLPDSSPAPGGMSSPLPTASNTPSQTPSPTSTPVDYGGESEPPATGSATQTLTATDPIAPVNTREPPEPATPVVRSDAQTALAPSTDAEPTSTPRPTETLRATKMPKPTKAPKPTKKPMPEREPAAPKPPKPPKPPKAKAAPED